MSGTALATATLVAVIIAIYTADTVAKRFSLLELFTVVFCSCRSVSHHLLCQKSLERLLRE
jgi:hypothetical protein